MLSSGRLNRFGTLAWSKPMAFHAKVVRVFTRVLESRRSRHPSGSPDGTGPWHPAWKLVKLLPMGSPSQAHCSPSASYAERRCHRTRMAARGPILPFRAGADTFAMSTRLSGASSGEESCPSPKVRLKG